MKYLPLDTAVSGHSGYQQQVKEANIKRIFDLVRSGKCKSRAEIVRVMNLSATSVSVLVEELAKRGLIDETGPAQTSLPGRRPISLRLNGDAHQLAVFSLHAGGVRYALINLECRVLESEFFPFDIAAQPDEDKGDSYARLFEDILRSRAKRFNPRRALMLGVSVPGVHLQSERTFCANAVLGASISEASMLRLQQRVSLPIYLVNDTHGMAYAEKKCLEAEDPDSRAVEDMLFVEIREGIGCAVIYQGDIYTGPYGIAGEIGHTTIDMNGRACPCGNVGCLERYVNQSAILEDARAAARAAGIPEPESFEALAERYADEPALLDSVKQSARVLGTGLYNLLCGTGIRRIVLGGGVERLGRPFLEEAYHAALSHARFIHSLDLSYAQAGPDAECVGLAHHFLDKVYTITT